MPTPVFPLVKFKLLYPFFDEFDDDLILAVADQAYCFITQCCADQLWMLMAAHMVQLRIDAGENPAPSGQRVASASIDKVSVSFSGPPDTNSTKWWLGLTRWGQQYMLLNKRCNGGPFYVSSLPERSAFRSVGGVFPNGGRVR